MEIKTKGRQKISEKYGIISSLTVVEQKNGYTP